MSPGSKTIYGQIIEYRKGKPINLFVSIKVYSVTCCPPNVMEHLNVLSTRPVGHGVCNASLAQKHDYQVLTDYIVPVAMNVEPSGAFTAPTRESADGALLPLLPISSLTFVEDRLYLASYTSPPTEDTLFPYPQEPTVKRSPNKRSSRAIDGPTLVAGKARNPPYYFCIDETLLYNAFHHDFGPLHIGHLYRFAVYLHDILGAPENKDKPVVFWSKADARSMLPPARL